MLIWLGVIVIFGVLAISSYYKGAVRSLVSLVGLFVALGLAMPLAPSLRGLIPKLGLTHPVWPYILPPVIVFVLIVLIFLGISFFVHFKVYLHFKYATDDFTRLRWERLNRRLGLCVGILAGAVYSYLLGLAVYVLGYPAVQLTTDASPRAQQLLRDARIQLAETGLDRSVAALDPMPPAYYLVTDLVGLVYNNPSVLERLANYPPFLQFEEMPEFKDLVTDAAFMSAIQTQAPFHTIANDPKVLGLIQNPQVLSVLRQVDPVDLFNYLKTGHSAKYAGEKILGRWRLLVSDTYVAARKQNPDMPPRQMRAIKTFVTVFLPGLSITATPEQRFHLKMNLTPQAKAMIKAIEDARRAAQQQLTQADPYGAGFDARTASRYGLADPSMGMPPEEQQKAQQSGLPDIPGLPDLNISGSGTWEKRGRRYAIQYKDAKGRNRRGTAEVEDDILRLTINNMTLVFLRSMREAD